MSPEHRNGSQGETQDTTSTETNTASVSTGPVPAMVAVFTRGKPVCTVFPLVDGKLVLGRDSLEERNPDPRMSRVHAHVTFDGASFSVRDCESRNGTFVDGEQVHGEVSGSEPMTLRIGTTVFLFRHDARDLWANLVQIVDETVVGPSLATALQTVQLHAQCGSNLFIHGESGTGKERVARHYHDSGPRGEHPFVAVNCGAIPAGMAERLFFGTRRGAYSGATANATGYIQAADRGTLFLDEVAELDLAVQAKLLRVLETKEVLPLGDVSPTRVDFAVCVATHRNLHEAVADGRFRQDLYYRIGRPEVHLPGLRERLEEIPWLAAQEVARVVAQANEAGQATPVGEGRPMPAELAIHATFIEACLLRYWPGNIRELLIETRSAAYAAMAQGSQVIKDGHLSERAGLRFARAEPSSAPDENRAASRQSSNHSSDQDPGPGSGQAEDARSDFAAALRTHQGNVSAAARALGVHRNKIRRWLESRGLTGRDFVDSEG